MEDSRLWLYSPGKLYVKCTYTTVAQNTDINNHDGLSQLVFTIEIWPKLKSTVKTSYSF